MFTTDKPPKYNGPINGRDRRLKKPKDFVLPDDEEDAENYEAMLQYLSIYSLEDRQETLSMVYACPKCEVRIANEDDMVTRPFIWSNEELSLNAVFKKTSNLVACGEDVCCYRCREKLFDYCAEDPFLLTVPMFQAKNKQTLMKRAYRMLSLTYTSGFSLFDLPEFEFVNGEHQFYSKEELVAMMKADDYPLNAGDAFVKDALRKLSTIFESFGEGKEVEVRRILAFDMDMTPYRELEQPELEKQMMDCLYRVHADFGTEFVLSEDLERHDAFGTDKTYDVAVLFRTGVVDSGFRNHADYHDVYITDIGKLHILPWLVSGGNFVFSDWGSYEDDLKPSDNVDADAESREWAYEMKGTNRQPTFAKLLRDGHFIGSWTYESDDKPNEPTPRMLQKIEEALAGRLLYPNWLFLHDYPSATFTETDRASQKPPYATTVADAFQPRRPSKTKNRTGLFDFFA